MDVPRCGALALLLIGCQVPRSDLAMAVADAQAPRLKDQALLDVRPVDFCTYRTEGRPSGEVSTTQTFVEGRVVASVHEFRGDLTERTWSYRDLPEGGLETTLVEDRSGRSGTRTEVTLTVEDAQGRPVLQRVDRHDDGDLERETTWTYDGLSTRVEVRTPEWSQVTTTRLDAFGNVLEEVVAYDGGPTLTTTCTYDDAGENPRLCVSESLREVWTYNEAGFEVTYRGSGSDWSRERDWIFDARGFPTEVLDQGGSRDIVFWDARLEYDDRGRLVLEDGTRFSDRLETIGPVDARRTFAYDDADRLTSERIEAGDGAWSATLRWAEDGRLLEYDASNDDGSDRFAHVLEYDEQGRLVTHRERQRETEWVGTWTYDCL